MNVCFLSRGLLRQIYTRIYFAGDPGAASDPILGLVPAGRRHTLMAQRAPGEPGTWEFIIRLQGDDETVFFEYEMTLNESSFPASGRSEERRREAGHGAPASARARGSGAKSPV